MSRLRCRFGLFIALAILFVSAGLRHSQAQKNDPPVASSPDGKLIITAQGNQISVIDVQTQKELIRILGHTAPVKALAVSPNGKIFASGGDDKSIRLFDLGTGKEILNVKTQIGVLFLSFSQDGKNLTSQHSDLTTNLWDIATGQLIESKKKQ